MRPLVIAHRGHSAAAPENSLAALERAVGSGADMVECDVRRAGDGVLVVSHDDTLDRLAGRPVVIAETGSDDLAVAAREAGAEVPTLAELMDAARTRVPLLLDVKSVDPGIVPDIAAVAAATGFDPAGLVLGVRASALVGPARDWLPGSGLLALHSRTAPLAWFLDAGVTLVRHWEARVDRSSVGELDDHGCAVWATVGGPETDRAVGDATEASLAAVLDAGIQGMLVNDPDLGRRVVDTRRG